MQLLQQQKQLGKLLLKWEKSRSWRFKLKYIDRIAVALISLVLVTWLTFSTVLFLNESNEIEFDESINQLVVTSTNNINTLNLFFDEFIRILELGANLLYDSEERFTSDIVTEVLNDIKETGDFLSVSINSQKGISYLPNQEHSELHPTYLELMESKEVIISDRIYDKDLEQYIIAISVPITTETEGDYYYLNGDLSLDKITSMLNESFFDKNVYFHVIDSKLEYIVNSKRSQEKLINLPFEEGVRQLQFEGRYSADIVLNAFKNKESGFCSYTYDDNIKDEGRYLYYAPVGINNWQYWALVPQSVIDDGAFVHSENALKYIFSIVSILVIAFAIVAIKIIQANKRNTTLQEAVQVFAEQTKKIIFDWDWKKDSHKNVRDFTGLLVGKRHKLMYQNVFRSIYPKDIDIMQDAFDNIVNGVDTTNQIVRLYGKSKSIMWFNFSTISLKDSKGKITKVYGFLENIDSTIKHTEKLTQNIRKDPLTQLYNKQATEELISALLVNDKIKKSALFFIDFDNFKQVNDTFGHSKGDEVLKNVTRELKSIFRQTDIIGRIGGDEFIAYLTNYGTIQLLREKAQLLCDSLRKTYSKGDVFVDVTFSVGIALAPEHGEDYKTLVNVADKALYCVKENGKNGYMISK